MDLDNLFDIAHADALERMKIEEDKMFLHTPREPGRPGCIEQTVGGAGAEDAILPYVGHLQLISTFK